MNRTNGIANVLLEEGEEFTQIYNEYIEKFGKLLDKPNMRNQLKQLVRLWQEIERNWDLVYQTKSILRDSKEYRAQMNLLLKLIQSWNLILTRMGLTLTSQTYIPVKERETYDPKELLQMTEKMKSFGKQLEAETRRRVHVGGKRDVEPLLIKKKKEEEETNGEKAEVPAS